jgi:hypothetical protein
MTAWKVKLRVRCDGVTGMSHCHNHSVCTVAVGSTQPVTTMITRNIFWAVKAVVRRADRLTNSVCWLPWNLGASHSWKPWGLSIPLQEFIYLFYDAIRCANNHARAHKYVQVFPWLTWPCLCFRSHCSTDSVEGCYIQYCYWEDTNY